ncbi:hypothetical protein TOPH_00642 [Tolypocladium ophioglossoides CBS 100239]|uniref:Uncharacterized protein n=1 Tax=Tolypocladium ophioglossoides (strain CBS 100239) TaxID=1163406 RepID=A0A0L0NM32_TOLOC|nr:hypothetical protein TOPH_00642 [Tolypocladium ophioglossoides CBS 100239]
MFVLSQKPACGDTWPKSSFFEAAESKMACISEASCTKRFHSSTYRDLAWRARTSFRAPAVGESHDKGLQRLECELVYDCDVDDADDGDAANRGVELRISSQRVFEFALGVAIAGVGDDYRREPQGEEDGDEVECRSRPQWEVVAQDQENHQGYYEKRKDGEYRRADRRRSAHSTPYAVLQAEELTTLSSSDPGFEIAVACLMTQSRGKRGRRLVPHLWGRTLALN